MRRKPKLRMNQEGYQSIRLVTASYHMPRSIQEFHHYMPQVRLVPHAVFPVKFKREQWWRWPGTASLILTEHQISHVVRPPDLGQRNYVHSILGN